MQPDDAFWGARLVSRFSDQAIRAIVESAGYDDPQAVEYLVNTLIRRRDIVARRWLNGVNPIVDVSLSPAGALTFSNAAVDARVATHGTYTIAWARFDNGSGATEQIAVEKQTSRGARRRRCCCPRRTTSPRRSGASTQSTQAGGSRFGSISGEKAHVEDRRTLSKTIGLDRRILLYTLILPT